MSKLQVKAHDKSIRHKGQFDFIPDTVPLNDASR